MYHADLYRGSVNLHLTSLNRQWMRERSTERARLPECPSGGVMYICENRLSCPRKVKSVLTTLCWSAEPLKVALKVKMISAALHIIITLHISNESAFLNVQLNERWPTQRQSLTATVWRNNETALTETRLKHAGEISTEKYLVSQIRGSELTVLYVYIYMCMLTIDYRSYCQVYVLLFGPLFCHSLPFTSLPVSTWFSFGSIGFWIWPRYIVTRTHRLYI